MTLDDVTISDFTATAKCIKCLSPHAPIQSGHVHTSADTDILASWCEPCHDKEPNIPDTEEQCMGCYGDWTVDMGVTELSYKQLAATYQSTADSPHIYDPEIDL